MLGGGGSLIESRDRAALKYKLVLREEERKKEEAVMGKK